MIEKKSRKKKRAPKAEREKHLKVRKNCVNRRAPAPKRKIETTWEKGREENPRSSEPKVKRGGQHHTTRGGGGKGRHTASENFPSDGGRVKKKKSNKIRTGYSSTSAIGVKASPNSRKEKTNLRAREQRFLCEGAVEKPETMGPASPGRMRYCHPMPLDTQPTGEGQRMLLGTSTTSKTEAQASTVCGGGEREGVFSTEFRTPRKQDNKLKAWKFWRAVTRGFFAMTQRFVIVRAHLSNLRRIWQMEICSLAGFLHLPRPGGLRICCSLIGPLLRRPFPWACRSTSVAEDQEPENPP